MYFVLSQNKYDNCAHPSPLQQIQLVAVYEKKNALRLATLITETLIQANSK